MIFPQVDQVPRHPSQLYELVLEGVVLFVVLWLFARRGPARGKVSAAFLIGYGCFRFLVEFTREPDSFLGLLSLGMSMGQWLSLPMIIGGVVLWRWASTRARGRLWPPELSRRESAGPVSRSSWSPPPSASGRNLTKDEPWHAHC